MTDTVWGLRTQAKGLRDKALLAADRARERDDSDEAYLAWHEARHQAHQTYTRAVLAIPSVLEQARGQAV